MPRPLHPILALVPARGGSKGLPGKNVRPLAGRPLVAHAVRLALSCPEVARVVCSTDSEEIAAAAREAGAEVPFMRPAELCTDQAAMWPVVRHALDEASRIDNLDYGSVLLVDPTTPGRLVADVSQAVAQLEGDENADGVVGVSEPEFNPIWYCVVERDGFMSDLMPEARTYVRRQDVPRVFRINGALYLWRSDFVRSVDNWRDGRLLMCEIPESRAVNIDTLADFQSAERAVAEGRIVLP